jgi:phosphatidylserine decarboxylase
VSVFLSPLDVHINRSPASGQVRHLGYTPGRRLLTLDNRASEVNEHSTIFIEGPLGPCLVRQIVGPVVRRVVYWLEPGQEVERGGRIGLMKFGSRLDMYFPAEGTEVTVRKGDRVHAGVSVVARRRSCAS